LGTIYANFFWDYSWVGIVVSILLFAALVAGHVKESSMLYDVTYFSSIWLLIAWFGAALISMETCFAWHWNCVHGEHW
jgi:hypothetical protein